VVIAVGSTHTDRAISISASWLAVASSVYARSSTAAVVQASLLATVLLVLPSFLASAHAVNRAFPSVGAGLAIVRSPALAQALTLECFASLFGLLKLLLAFLLSEFAFSSALVGGVFQSLAASFSGLLGGFCSRCSLCLLSIGLHLGLGHVLASSLNGLFALGFCSLLSLLFFLELF